MPLLTSRVGAPTGAAGPIAPPGLNASANMLVAMAAFGGMGTFIRLAAEHMPVLEVVFFRNFFAVLLLAPLVLRKGIDFLRTRRLKLHLTRNLIGAVGMAAGFTGVTLIPLAQSQALGFTAPLFTTLGALLFLGERVRIHRLSALAAGFVGVLIVLEPATLFSASALSVGSLLVILSSALIGVSALIMKSLTKSDSPEAISLWMVLLQTPISLVAAVVVWQTPSLTALFWALCVASCGTIGHVFWSRACAQAEMTRLQPFEFLKLPISATLGFLIFDQIPGGSVWLGGAVIFLATAYIAHRERQLGKTRLAPKRAVE